MCFKMLLKMLCCIRNSDTTTDMTRNSIESAPEYIVTLETKIKYNTENQINSTKIE